MNRRAFLATIPAIAATVVAPVVIAQSRTTEYVIEVEAEFGDDDKVLLTYFDAKTGRSIGAEEFALADFQRRLQYAID